MSKLIENTVKLYNELVPDRTKEETDWKEIMRLFLPGVEFKGIKQDDDREELFDSTPEDANEFLAANIQDILTNPSYTWMKFRPVGLDGDLNTEQRKWLEMATEKLMEIFNSDKTGFRTESHQMYRYAAPLGTGVFYSEEDDEAGMTYQNYPIFDCCLISDPRGRIIGLIRECKFKAHQIVKMFDEYSDEVKEAAQQKPNQEFSCIHSVLPWDFFGQEDKMKVKEHTYRGCYIELKSKHCMEESGYFEFPYHVPRWHKDKKPYGRGLGHKACPDARALNAIERDSLIASEKAADPPTFAPDDCFTESPSSDGGSYNYYRNSYGKDKIFQLPHTTDLRVYDAKAEQKRNALRKIFLNDRLQNPGGPQMTATEVVEIVKINYKVLGPVASRFEMEFLAPVVERTLKSQIRAGAIPPFPGENQKVKIEYVSPITQSQKQVEAKAFMDAMAYLQPVAQIAPETLKNFDFHAIVRDTQPIFNYSSTYLVPEEKRDEELAAQQAEAQKQKQMMEAQQTAELAKTGKEVLPNAQQE